MNKLISGGAWPDDDMSGARPNEKVKVTDAVQMEQPMNLTVVVIVRLAVGRALINEPVSNASDSWRGGWGWHGDGGGC